MAAGMPVVAITIEWNRPMLLKREFNGFKDA